ncbi:MAG: DMT family transporter [Planctomycetota bacterium]
MGSLRSLAPPAVLLLLVATWGVSYVAVKDALASLPPSALVAQRFWLAAATLAPVLVRGGAGRDLRAAAGLGCAGGALLALGFVLQGFGMRETSAAMGGFVAGLIPLLVAGGGWLFLGARVGRRGALGLALGGGGLLCLVWPGASAPGEVRDTLRGVLLQVGAAVGFASHVLLLSRFGRRVPALAFCLWQVVVTALVATVLAASEGADAALAGSTVAAVGARWLPFDLLFLGVLATGLAIPAQVRVQPLVAPMHVALLFATQPLFAALAGVLVRHETLRPVQAIGGAAIVAGIVVAALDRPRWPVGESGPRKRRAGFRTRRAGAPG